MCFFNFCNTRKEKSLCIFILLYLMLNYLSHPFLSTLVPHMVSKPLSFNPFLIQGLLQITCNFLKNIFWRQSIPWGSFYILSKAIQKIQMKRDMSDSSRCTVPNYSKGEKSSNHDNRSCLWGILYLHLEELAVEQILTSKGILWILWGKIRKSLRKHLTKFVLSAEDILNTSAAS